MAQNLSIAICILFFEKAQQTVECVQSFLPSGVPIYVLNNNSSQESTQTLKDFCADHPQVKIFDSSENLGVSGGRNFLIKNTCEEWLFFVDNDITIKGNQWLGILANYILNFPEADAFIPKLYNSLEKNYSNYYSISISENKKISKTIDNSGLVNIFPGGASIINSGVFDRLGLYDEAMFVGFEDVEFGIRGLLENKAIQGRLMKDIKLIHKHIQSQKKVDQLSSKTRYDTTLNRKSWEYLNRKHGLLLEENWEWLNSKAAFFIDGKKYKKKTDPRIISAYYSICGFLLKFKVIKDINNHIKKWKKRK